MTFIKSFLLVLAATTIYFSSGVMALFSPILMIVGLLVLVYYAIKYKDEEM